MSSDRLSSWPYLAKDKRFCLRIMRGRDRAAPSGARSVGRAGERSFLGG